MSLRVLDSDTLSLWFHGQSSVLRRVANTDPNDLAVTIVTVEEVLRGWYTQIRRAKNDDQLARSYESLQQAVEFTSEVRILPFDLSSIQRFRQLRTAHRRTGTNDLRIASIVLKKQRHPRYAQHGGLRRYRRLGSGRLVVVKELKQNGPRSVI